MLVSLPRHIPVMLAEVVEVLTPQPGDIYLDCTAGLGGHAAAMAVKVAPGGAVVLNDADLGNLEYAASRVRTASSDVRIEVLGGNFANVPRMMADRGLRANLVLADLGFASNQVEDSSRGLSFSRDGPLDMRLDRSLPTTAADLVNSLPEQELGRVIAEYGEDRNARRIARRIVQARARGPIRTTAELAGIVRSASGPSDGGIDPATRTFQALRIMVNDELGSLEALLESVVAAAEGAGMGEAWLAANARVAVISFHSLEDRLVKRAFARITKLGGTDIAGGVRHSSDEESQSNPRARSARLRAIRLP